MINESREIIVGIDLGTTNSEIAVYYQGKMSLIPIDGPEKEKAVMPSVVGFTPDEQLIVGCAAKNQYIAYPERTVMAIKRRMGSELKLKVGEQSYSPAEISAFILKKLKSSAEAYLNQPIHKAVITVPAFFSDAQRQATVEAGELAGLEVVRIINEPTAAALAYEVSQETHKRVLVYDLGGGTFDVSIAALSQGVVQILASDGDNHLGGNDFDELLVSYFKEELNAKYPGSLVFDTASRARLMLAAEQAKITLSTNPFVMVSEEFIAVTKNGKPVHLKMELSRSFYENLIQALLDKTFKLTQKTLEQANLTSTDIDEVILVGGSARTPAIHQFFREKLNLSVRQDIDPELCVAMGAAVQGAIISGQPISKILVDVTPYSFGISVLNFNEETGKMEDDYYSCIIPKNTPLPCVRTEVYGKVFPTQNDIHLRVFQGEASSVHHNLFIGELFITGLRKYTDKEEILVKFELNINGILKVTASAKDTKVKTEATFQNAIQRMSEKNRGEAKARLNALFDDAQDDFQVEPQPFEDEQLLLVKAKLLMEFASEIDKAELQNHMDRLQRLLTGETEPVAVKSAVERLRTLCEFVSLKRVEPMEVSS